MKSITYNSDIKQRLDKYMASEFSDYSRAIWQKHIKHGAVMVNNTRVTPHYTLLNSDVITVNIIPETKPEVPDWNIRVLKETPDYIIVNKPAGLVVHPTQHTKIITLADLITRKYPEVKTIGDDFTRPGIVHRLDKDVSGVMVIARTPEMFTRLKQQFHDRQVKKIYHALVHEPLHEPNGQITFKIERGKNGKMVARPQSQEGKEAITEYTVLKNFIHYSYVEILLKTGRSHQIRVHFNAIGHPLAGEKLYRPKKLKSNLKLDRLFLHAHLLGFTDMNDEWHEYTSPLPSELTDILNQLT